MSNIICQMRGARGAIAQLVEQRTENPCVTGSIPVGTTKNDSIWDRFFVRVPPFMRVCKGDFFAKDVEKPIK